MTLNICSYRRKVVINDAIHAHMHDTLSIAHGHCLLVLLLLTSVCQRWLLLHHLILMLLVTATMLSCAICLSLVTIVIVMVATAPWYAAILNDLETLLAVTGLLDDLGSMLIWLTTIELFRGSVFKFCLLQGTIQLCLCCRGHAYHRNLLIRLCSWLCCSSCQCLLALTALELLRRCIWDLLLLESLHVHSSGYLCLVSLLLLLLISEKQIWAATIIYLNYLQLLPFCSAGWVMIFLFEFLKFHLLSSTTLLILLLLFWWSNQHLILLLCSSSHLLNHLNIFLSEKRPCWNTLSTRVALFILSRSTSLWLYCKYWKYQSLNIIQMQIDR